jgi:outer membrane protein
MRVVPSIAALAALLAATPALADNLDDAMVQAAQTNPTLAAARARLAATREALPQAWAEALPSISISAGASHDNVTHQTSTESWSASANASQLLFGSGSVIASTRAARAEVKGAVADYQSTLQSFLIQVVSTYADVRQAQEVVAARDKSVSDLTTLFDYAQAQFNAGVVTRTDVAQAEARLAQARTQLVQAQGGLAAAVQAYQRLVGAPPNNLEAPPEATGLPSDLQTALETAGQQSPVLASAEAAADQADASVWVARSAGLPRLSLEAGTSIANDFDAPSSARQTSDSLGVRFSWPLLNGGAVASRTRQANDLRSAANLDVAAAQRSVQESVTNAWTGLASARAALVSARQQEQASQLAFQGVRLERETGLRSTVDVLNQEADLLTSQLALAQAEHDLVVAERQMLAAMGVLEARDNAGDNTHDRADIHARRPGPSPALTAPPANVTPTTTPAPNPTRAATPSATQPPTQAPAQAPAAPSSQPKTARATRAAAHLAPAHPATGSDDLRGRN